MNKIDFINISGQQSFFGKYYELNQNKNRKGQGKKHD